MPSKLGKFKKVHPKGPAEPGGGNCPHSPIQGRGADYAFPGGLSLGLPGSPWQTPDFGGSVKNNTDTPRFSDLPTALYPHNNMPPAP